MGSNLNSSGEVWNVKEYLSPTSNKFVSLESLNPIVHLNKWRIIMIRGQNLGEPHKKRDWGRNFYLIEIITFSDLQKKSRITYDIFVAIG